MKRILLLLFILVPVSTIFAGDSTSVMTIKPEYRPVITSTWMRRTVKADPFFRVSPKVSALIAWLGTDADSSKSDGARGGVLYGLDFELGITNNFWICFGLYHNVLGGNTRYEWRDTSGIHNKIGLNTNLQYIEVPVYFKFKSDPIKDRWTVWGQVGITGAVLLDAKTRIQNFSNEILVSETHANAYNGFVPVRASVPIGAGFEYIFHSKMALRAGVQFHNGFTNIYKDDINGRISTPVKEVGRLKYFEFMVGVVF